MKIFAHRGFSHKYPEATRAAYQGAIEVGVDGFECDVRLTKDGVPVCFHDRDLKRIAGVKKRVASLTLSELQEITEVMTLVELLELAKANLFSIRNKDLNVLKVLVKSNSNDSTLEYFSFNHLIWL